MNKQKLFEELLKKKGIHVPKGPVLSRREEKGPHPVSFAQRRIWFLQQFDKESGAYNDPTALRIIGPLDISTLEKTFNEIIKRHDVFRMNFPSENGQPVQSPIENVNLKIEIEELQISGERDIQAFIREFVNRFSGEAFDIAKEPLIKVRLLKIAHEDYALVVNIHHIILDGWSKGIMLRELMDLYHAFSEGKPSGLPELPIRYSDYVYWLHEWMQGKLFESQLNYWKNKLTGAPPVLELATDHPRPNIPSGKGSIQPFKLPQKLFEGIKNVAREIDVTVFMLLVGAYNILLQRYSGQNDICLGTPIAGRHRVELENLIGLFVNTLVLRTKIEDDATVESLLKQVRTTALEAYQNQDMPFEKLVEELNPQRNLSITPIFQVMFSLQNAPMPPADISGLTITPIQIDTGFAQVDLSLTMWEEENTYIGTFEYNLDLFDPQTIGRMADHFLILLEDIVANVKKRVSQLNILTKEESERILDQWNDTEARYPVDKCIFELFTECAGRYPDEVAVLFRETRMTYRELDDGSNRLAHFLQKKGIGRGCYVGICMENCCELLVGVMGILKAGGAYIPMDPQYPDRRLNAIVNDAVPQVVITQAVHAPRFTGHNENNGILSNGKSELLCLDTEWNRIGLENSTTVVNSCDPTYPGCVIYTSGSTGEPKGIVMENRSIVNLITSFIDSYHPGPGDRILPLTSIASASFVGEILPLITSGGAIVLADKVHFLEMKKLVALMADFGITILSTVPSMIARLNAMNAVDWNPGKLRLLLSGGEALSAGDIDRLVETVTIVNGYGLTEATICSTYIILNNESEKPDFTKNPVISVGKPIINTSIFILDKDMNPVPVGIPGEIYVGGAGITRGYLNNPVLTTERFIDLQGLFLEKLPLHRAKTSGNDMMGTTTATTSNRYYKTGDLGCWLADGNIKFLGRIDTQVQVHGYRIELSEIETNLGLHPRIQEAVVIDRDITPGDKRLVAYIVFKEGVKVSASELREWLGKRIPEYMIPAVFETLTTIPLNPNGKVDVKALPEPSWARPDLDVDFMEPQTEIETNIVEVWKEFLKLEKVGIHDNFFDLGGHSLLLTQVHSRLSDMYKHKKEITIVDLFRYPTVSSLAKYLGETETKSTTDTYQKFQTRAEKQRQALNRPNLRLKPPIKR